MTERATVPAAATLLLPLLAAAAVAPAGLDQALDPLLAGGLPLAWAALWSVLFQADHRRMAAAYVAVLPFAILALVSFASRPFAADLLVLTAGSIAITAVHSVPRRALGATTRRASRAGTGGRPGRLLATVAAALPGLLFAAFAGPWPGVAVSALLSVSAFYIRQRRLR